MRHQGISGIALLLGVVATAATAQAAEKKITRAQLPAAVEKTVTEQSRGAEIKGLSTETENGKKVFEVELIADGRSRDILIDEQGSVIEVEQEVPFTSLPEPVKTGLTAAAGKGTLGKVESLTKTGKLVAYEAVVTNGKKKTEVQVGPDGKKLARTE
jgi:uncharacterized membrane protein YkoI